jgi:hypothetical protein
MLNKFVPDEERLCKQVLGMRENDAHYLIKEYECVPFTAKRDKINFDYSNKCAHSYRVNLVVLKNRVLNAYLG